MNLRGRLFPGEHSTLRPYQRYVWTGEKRAVLPGEYYLSGAIPTAYRSPGGMSYPHHIMRPATEAEMRCPCCGQRKPINQE